MSVLRGSGFFSVGLTLSLGLLIASSSLGAIAPANVLVLYNASSPDGIDLANYYAQVHPGVQLLGITGVPTAEEITADDYLSLIRPQVLPALNSSISVIVTTKGLPLRINVTESNPGSYTDPYGVARTVGSGWWKPYSSLESELTRIEEVGTWQQMGDQTYYSPTGAPSRPQPSSNPYYGVCSAFSYSKYAISGYGGMRLTSRLDGFTTADVKAAIDRAQKAFVPSGASYVVMDDDPAAGTDRMVQLRDIALTPKGQNYVYDNTSAAVTTAPGPVVGYVSYGIHGGGLSPGYITNQLNFQLAGGAVFDTHESYNAYSFQPGGNLGGQGLVAEWLQIGGTAGVGNVQEPLNGSNYEANEDQLFRMLLNGYTWGEAAWSSLRQLSYVNTVVGDPLMTWKAALAGDINLDGTVNGADFNTILSNYNKSGMDWTQGDMNGDGVVNGADLNIVLANFGAISGTSVARAVPEPAVLGMLGLAAPFLAVFCGRRKRVVK
jgi:uncharacterized protein (TIGR03790 family)